MTLCEILKKYMKQLKSVKEHIRMLVRYDQLWIPFLWGMPTAKTPIAWCSDPVVRSQSILATVVVKIALPDRDPLNYASHQHDHGSNRTACTLAFVVSSINRNWNTRYELSPSGTWHAELHTHGSLFTPGSAMFKCHGSLFTLGSAMYKCQGYVV